jgi:phosphatidylglycerophosphate synthase
MVDTAVVVCPAGGLPEANLLETVRVAGLSLLTRVLLTARHAGIARFIVVASGDQQTSLRAALGREGRFHEPVEWQEPATDPRLPSGRCLVLLPSVVLTANALRMWLGQAPQADGIISSQGAGGGPVLVPADALGACVEAAGKGIEGLAAFLRRTANEGRLTWHPWDGLPPLSVRSAADAPAVERAMLKALRTPEDGPIVDRYVNRTVSGPLTRLLVRSPITPNQLTLVSLLTGLLAAWVLGHEGWWLSLLGLALFQSSVILDHSDGEVARLTFQFSPLGKWLDNWSDHVVDLTIIACLARRVSASMGLARVVGLGLAAAAGVTGSFLVVFFWTLRGGTEGAGASSRRAADTLISMANRDGFCLALWATVLIGRPAWFLWTLALGSNLYWLAWLVLCGLPSRAKAGEVGPGITGA